MKEFFSDPASWLSIISVVVAIGALLQTKKQIELSNKHQLFDRRINNYMMFRDLHTLWNANRVILTGKRAKEPIISLHSEFIWLTNCAYLEEITPLIMEPNQTGELHRKFMQKREELKKFALEASLIFPKDQGEYVSDFFNAYEELLATMRLYQIFINGARKEPIELEFDEKMKLFGEPEKREQLLGAYTKLESIHKTICDRNLISMMEDEIKPTK